MGQSTDPWVTNYANTPEPRYVHQNSDALARLLKTAKRRV